MENLPGEKASYWSRSLYWLLVFWLPSPVPQKQLPALHTDPRAFLLSSPITGGQRGGICFSWSFKTPLCHKAIEKTLFSEGYVHINLPQSPGDYITADFSNTISLPLHSCHTEPSTILSVEEDVSFFICYRLSFFPYPHEKEPWPPCLSHRSSS